MPLPLRDMMRILAIAEHGSVTQAARALHVAQPALSRTISNLEEYLGVRIFERGHAGVRATPEGELLLARAKSIQGELNRLERDAIAIQSRQVMRVVIGVVPVHPLDQQTRAIVELLADYPDNDFGVVPDSMDGLLARLAAGTIDFIFAPLPEQPAGPGYIEEPIYWEQLVVACGPGSPLYSMEAPTPEMACGQPWTVGEEGSPSHALLLEFCRANGQAVPRVRLMVDAVPARRAALEHSDMLSIFQHAQVHVTGKPGLLRALPIRWPQRPRPVGTIRSSASPAALHQTFAARIRQVLSADGMQVVE